jgi:hypothetical protein
MALAPSPLDAFNVGQSIGRANSPVTGIGMAIKNVLENAQKRGLLKAQSQFQAGASNQVNILKEGREEAKRDLPLTTTFFDPSAPEGQQTTDVQTTRGAGPAKAVTRPPVTLAQEIKELRQLNPKGGPDKGADGIVDIIGNAELDAKASRYLLDRGKPDVPENRQAVIERGLVQ